METKNKKQVLTIEISDGKAVISQEERDRLMQGHYQVKTCVPLVDAPETREYMLLTQKDLAAFLEDLDEHCGEFVISVTRE